MFALIAAAFASATPLSAVPVALSVSEPSWSTEADFDGAAVLNWSVRHGPLTPTSWVRVRVDGRLVAEVALDGTPVPPIVPLGHLEGPHTVTVESRLAEPGTTDCEPGEPWLTLDSASALEGVARSVRPARFAADLRGRSVELEGDDPILLLEARGTLEAWGAKVESGGLPVEVRAGPRQVARWETGGMLQGDTAFLRALREPETLGRCEQWPCSYGPGAITPPQDDGTTLSGLGFDKGLTLTGRQQRTLVFRLPGPAAAGVLRLDVARTGVPLDDASHLSIRIDDQPIGTWSVATLSTHDVLSVALPDWALQRRYLRVVVEVDLVGEIDTCERTGTLPWIRLGPRSGLDATSADVDGLAGDADRIGRLPVAGICLEGDVDEGLMRVLGGLRPTGGWTLDCDAPDLRVTNARPAGYGGEKTWWSTGSDVVAESPTRWVVQSGAPLRIHRPRDPSVPAPLPWLQLEGDEVLSTERGWSERRTERLSEGLASDGVQSDGERRRAMFDLLFAMLAAALALFGVFWVWRSRGSRDQWMEPLPVEQVDPECSTVGQPIADT